jgi:hypothetical protein
MMSEPPDWYDESKIVKAIFTFENGRSVETGWVIDLGDGTCRLANRPIGGIFNWGDRVDLFYHPSFPLDIPMIGYRLYDDDDEPVGRHLAMRRDPDEEELKKLKEREERKEAHELAMIELSAAPALLQSEVDKLTLENADLLIKYYQLMDWINKQGLEIPDNHHENKEKETPSEEERRETKLYLLAVAGSSYRDIEIPDEEVQAETQKMIEESKWTKSFSDCFDGDDDDD